MDSPPKHSSDHGRTATRPREIPASGWKEILQRTWTESGKDNIGIVAAGVAFYGFLALIPLLGATVLTYGLVAEPQTVLEHARAITRMLPGEAGQFVGEQLLGVLKTSEGKKGLGVLLALAIALWGARNAAGSVVTALNIAYEQRETRNFLKTTLLALVITVAAVLLALFAGGAIAVLAAIQRLLPDLGPVGSAGFSLLTYILLGAVAAAAAATLFRYGPARAQAQWRWLTPGSVLFALGWIVLTLGFGFYVKSFGNYGATYGSLSAIVVLLTWLYLSSYLLLLAAELNSEVEHQTEADTTTGKGKPLGERGVWSADHVAVGESETGNRELAMAASPAPKTSTSEVGPPAAKDHTYLASRLTSRTAPMVGAARVSMLGSVVATVGLGLLKKKGSGRVGAALLTAAAGLAYLRRK